MRQKEGYVYQNKVTKTWYARVCYTKNNGKRSSIKRSAQNRTHAKEVLKDLLEKFKKNNVEAIQSDKFTFNFLADFYEKHYAIEPQYVAGRKVAGLRSLFAVRGYLKVLREHFGMRKLQSITYEDIKSFQLIRLETKTRNHKQRTITTVNRELACLRRMFNIARKKAWINENPFNSGDNLIHISDEVKRERILTQDEERLLLEECYKQIPLLYSLVIAALDSGCRQNELLKLTWEEVDFDSNIICLLAFNTKTARERKVGMTERTRNELLKLWTNYNIQDLQNLVFPFVNRYRVHYSFAIACKKAGIEGLRFHDLRHTHATRLDDLGVSLAKIGSQLGHTVLQTTLRYINRDQKTTQNIASALDSFNAYGVQTLSSVEEVKQDFIN